MRILSFIALAFALGAASPSRAADIAIALSDDLVEVDAGFAGERVVLFGALASGTGAPAPGRVEDYDIVAVVRGPDAVFRLRPMLRERMIWVAGPAIDIAAPEILLTGSSRPIEDIAPLETLRALNIGEDAATLAARLAPSAAGAGFVKARGAESVSRAFLEHARREGRFKDTVDAVVFKKGALFSINVELAPATPVGDYTVDAYLFRDGALISRDNARLSVKKVGVERQVYDLAHNQPLAYGIGCVLIALVAGWLAAAAFRK